MGSMILIAFAVVGGVGLVAFALLVAYILWLGDLLEI